MQQIRSSRPMFAFILDLVYLAGRLAANSLTAAFLPPVDAMIARLRTLRTELEAAEEAEVRAQAVRDATDDTTDALIMDAGRQALLVYRRRDSEGYQNLFRRAPSEMVADAIADEVQEARTLAAKMRATGDAALAATAAAIDSAATSLEADQQALHATRTPVAVARGNRDLAKAEANVLRDRAFGQIISVLPGQRDRVEGFFRDVRSRRRAEAGASGAGDAAAVAEEHEG
jgi:hypothetical protein